MRVIGISGSLRKASYNSMALRAAQKLAPEGMTIEIETIGDFPLYNEDVKAAGMPAEVTALRDKIRAADGVLFACPEYNFSVTGVLKNAIDWLSRPPDQPFEGKPVALFGASQGPVGTARAQYHLRQILLFLNPFTLNKPEVFIASAQTKFDADGTLTDADTEKFLRLQLEAFAAHIKRINGSK